MVTVLYSSVLTNLDCLSTFNKECVKLVAISDDNVNSVQQDIAAASKQSDFGKLLIVYPSLESVLFNAACESVDPSVAIHRWQTFINFAIHVTKRNRGVCYLISDRTLSKHSHELQTLLGLQLFETHSSFPDPVIIPAIFKLIVTSFLENDPALKRMVHQAVALECVAANYDEPELGQVVNSVCHQWLNLTQTADNLAIELSNVSSEVERVKLDFKQTDTELAKHQAALNDANEENHLLLEQLHLVQESIESQLIEAKTKADELNTFNQELASTKSELDRTKLDLKQADAEIATLSKAKKELEKNLTFAQKEFEELKKKTETEVAEHHKTHSEATKALVGSHEKQLAELNTLHQSALNDVNEENQLLLEQLHLVQEALEVQFLKTESLKKQLSEKEAESKQLAISAKRYQFNLNQLQITQSIKSPYEKFKSKRKALKLAKVIESSPLFNAEWYLQQYPDVAEHPTFKSRPALHYLQIGAFEGRNPSADFDSEGYLAVNSDVEDQHMNPLLHYILHGHEEGRDPKP